MRPFKSRAADVGRKRGKYVARRFGQELRLARMGAGLTQAQVAARADVSQQVVSEAERGHIDISLDTRCRLTAACGHELGLRLYPVATVSLRDSGQLAIAQSIASAAHPAWTAELEHPVAPGDLRAADLLLGLPDEILHIEIERALVDAQAQLRAAQIKRTTLAEQDARPIRLVIAVPSTRVSRERIAQISDLVRQTLPVASRDIWRAIRGGSPVGGDGILFVRPDRVRRPPVREGYLPERLTRP
jgi:transcriptional regulator with XRE-family HTH domain